MFLQDPDTGCKFPLKTRSLVLWGIQSICKALEDAWLDCYGILNIGMYFSWKKGAYQQKRYRWEGFFSPEDEKQSEHIFFHPPLCPTFLTKESHRGYCEGTEMRQLCCTESFFDSPGTALNVVGEWQGRKILTKLLVLLLNLTNFNCAGKGVFRCFP